MIRSFRGTTPSIAVSAYVDPSAVVIGDVRIGERSSIWPNVTIRGDVDHIEIGAETSIQDGTVLHCDAGVPCSVGNRVTVGHLAMLHGCTVEDDALIGIGAIVLNGARIGKGAVVAAGALVAEGAEVPAGMLAVGVPAKPKRAVSDEEQKRFSRGVKSYVEKAAIFGRARMKAVKGTRDILPPASAVWNRVEAVAREVFRTFNYHEIRTPIFEETALFARGVGEDTDIVGKEMYTWEDRDGTSLTLRPEATASVMRAYIEHRLDQIPGIKKFYYMGPMFRRERPQKGRYRQFFQIGAEAIGSESAIVDAEVIEMVVDLLKRVGLHSATEYDASSAVPAVVEPGQEGFHLILNSVGCSTCRPKFMSALKEKLATIAPTLCVDCQRRSTTNPLRVLDCKVPDDQAAIDTLPSILDYLCEDCHAHFRVVQEHLHQRRIRFEVRPRLVRGLDYYMRTTFEITHGALGAQNAVLGGGRYDGLAESLGSKVPAPGIGFSIGEDRLVMSVGEGQEASVDVFLAPLGDAAEVHAGALAAELRGAGISVERSVDRKLKRALETANKMGARFALILGDNEIAAGTYLIKDMASGEQVPLGRERLIEHIKK